MKRNAVLLAVSALLMATLACSISIPSVDIMTGPETETVIDVPRLADPSQEAYVTLAFGANELRLSPGASQGLVSGTIRTNLKDFQPTVTINGADNEGENWDRLIQPLDRGSFDVYGFLKTLRGLGYTGPVGLQCYGIQGDAREHLARSINAWRKLSGRLDAEK